MTTINIAGLDKAAVLAALYNASRLLGMGFLHARSGSGMTVEEAASVLADAGSDPYFDYLYGRVMKVSLHGDDLDPWGYDRDNGPGAAEAAIEKLRVAADAA